MNVRVVASILLALLVGCPRQSITTPRELTIEDYRERAAENPSDSEFAFDLAAAEALRPDGDHTRLAASLQRAADLAPSSPKVAALQGLVLYARGDLSGSFDAFERAFSSAEESGETAITEVALSGIAQLDDLIPAYRSRVRALHARSAVASLELAKLQGEIALREGNVDGEALRISRSGGCLTNWRIAGPFGPYELLGFDTTFEAEGVGPLRDSYDLGPGRGQQPTRVRDEHSCALHLGTSTFPAGGTSYAEAFPQIEGGTYALKVETPNAVEVRVDGVLVIRRDTRREPVRRVTYHPITLTSGRHEIEVKVTTRHPNPVLSIGLVRAEIADVESMEDWVWSRTVPESLFERFVRSSVRASRGAIVHARTEALSLGRGTVGPLAELLRSSIWLADPTLPEDVARDRARRSLRAAIEQDPTMWLPRWQLARLEAAEGHAAEALTALTELNTEFANVLPVRFALLDALLSQGWFELAREHVDEAERLLPGGCGVARASFALAQQSEIPSEVSDATERMMTCDQRGIQRFQWLTAARRWEEAENELNRLKALDSEPERFRFSELEIARASGDEARVEQLIASIREMTPRSAAAMKDAVDRLLAVSNEGAVRALASALKETPTDFAELRGLYLTLSGQSMLDDYRIAANDALAAYLGAGVDYDEPQVLALDYSAIRIFEDFGALQLVHQIYEVRSDESLDELSEITVPEGALVLALHTIKREDSPPSEWRRLRPDLIPGKETISMPNVEVGDFIEFEYLHALDAPLGLPNGALGERFYFASYDMPFFRTEQVIVAPTAMRLELLPRGNAPQVVRTTEGALDVYRFRADRNAALVAEPGGVNPTEFLPSINWAVNAPWGAFVASLRDALADKDRFDPAAAKLARTVAGDGSEMERARRLYDWVVRETENNQNVFGDAPAMLAAKAGNGARIFHYLCGLVGLRSELWLVRGIGNSQERTEVANEETYSNLVVHLQFASEELFVQPTARGAAFGYLNPALLGQDGLVLTHAASEQPDHARFGQIPSEPLREAARDRRHVDVVLRWDEEDVAVISVTEQFWGYEAIQWRNDIEGINAAEREERFEEGYIVPMFWGGELLSLAIEGLDDTEGPMELRYDVRLTGFGRPERGGLFVDGFFRTHLTERFATTASRTTTALVAPPIHLQLQVRFRPHPRLGQLASPDASQEADMSFTSMSFRQDYQLDGTDLLLRREVHIPIRRVPPEEYVSFTEFCRAADALEIGTLLRP